MWQLHEVPYKIFLFEHPSTLKPPIRRSHLAVFGFKAKQISIWFAWICTKWLQSVFISSTQPTHWLSRCSYPATCALDCSRIYQEPKVLMSFASTRLSSSSRVRGFIHWSHKASGKSQFSLELKYFHTDVSLPQFVPPGLETVWTGFLFANSKIDFAFSLSASSQKHIVHLSVIRYL